MDNSWSLRNNSWPFLAKFILKIDDDEILNTPKLISEFRQNPFYKYEQKNMYAMIFSGIGRDRNPASKWFVSMLEFNTTYPPEYNGI